MTRSMGVTGLRSVRVLWTAMETHLLEFRALGEAHQSYEVLLNRTYLTSRLSTEVQVQQSKGQEGQGAGV